MPPSPWETEQVNAWDVARLTHRQPVRDPSGGFSSAQRGGTSFGGSSCSTSACAQGYTTSYTPTPPSGCRPPSAPRSAQRHMRRADLGSPRQEAPGYRNANGGQKLSSANVETLRDIIDVLRAAVVEDELRRSNSSRSGILHKVTAQLRDLEAREAESEASCAWLYTELADARSALADAKAGAGQSAPNQYPYLRKERETQRLEEDKSELNHTVDLLRQRITAMGAQSLADAAEEAELYDNLACSEEMCHKLRDELTTLQQEHQEQMSAHQSALTGEALEAARQVAQRAELREAALAAENVAAKARFAEVEAKEAFTSEAKECAIRWLQRSRRLKQRGELANVAAATQSRKLDQQLQDMSEKHAKEMQTEAEICALLKTGLIDSEKAITRAQENFSDEASRAEQNAIKGAQTYAQLHSELKVEAEECDALRQALRDAGVATQEVVLADDTSSEHRAHEDQRVKIQPADVAGGFCDTSPPQGVPGTKARMQNGHVGEEGMLDHSGDTVGPENAALVNSLNEKLSQALSDLAAEKSQQECADKAFKALEAELCDALEERNFARDWSEVAEAAERQMNEEFQAQIKERDDAKAALEAKLSLAIGERDFAGDSSAVAERQENDELQALVKERDDAKATAAAAIQERDAAIKERDDAKAFAETAHPEGDELARLRDECDKLRMECSKLKGEAEGDAPKQQSHVDECCPLEDNLPASDPQNTERYKAMEKALRQVQEEKDSVIASLKATAQEEMRDASQKREAMEETLRVAREERDSAIASLEEARQELAHKASTQANKDSTLEDVASSEKSKDELSQALATNEQLTQQCDAAKVSLDTAHQELSKVLAERDTANASLETAQQELLQARAVQQKMMNEQDEIHGECLSALRTESNRSLKFQNAAGTAETQHQTSNEENTMKQEQTDGNAFIVAAQQERSQTLAVHAETQTEAAVKENNEKERDAEQEAVIATNEALEKAEREAEALRSECKRLKAECSELREQLLAAGAFQVSVDASKATSQVTELKSSGSSVALREMLEKQQSACEAAENNVQLLKQEFTAQRFSQCESEEQISALKTELESSHKALQDAEHCAGTICNELHRRRESSRTPEMQSAVARRIKSPEMHAAMVGGAGPENEVTRLNAELAEALQLQNSAIRAEAAAEEQLCALRSEGRGIPLDTPGLSTGLTAPHAKGSSPQAATVANIASEVVDPQTSGESAALREQLQKMQKEHAASENKLQLDVARAIYEEEKIFAKYEALELNCNELQAEVNARAMASVVYRGSQFAGSDSGSASLSPLRTTQPKAGGNDLVTVMEAPASVGNAGAEVGPHDTSTILSPRQTLLSRAEALGEDLDQIIGAIASASAPPASTPTASIVEIHTATEPIASCIDLGAMEEMITPRSQDLLAKAGSRAQTLREDLAKIIGGDATTQDMTVEAQHDDRHGLLAIGNSSAMVLGNDVDKIVDTHIPKQQFLADAQFKALTLMEDLDKLIVASPPAIQPAKQRLVNPETARENLLQDCPSEMQPIMQRVVEPLAPQDKVLEESLPEMQTTHQRVVHPQATQEKVLTLAAEPQRNQELPYIDELITEAQVLRQEREAKWGQLVKTHQVINEHEELFLKALEESTGQPNRRRQVVLQVHVQALQLERDGLEVAVLASKEAREFWETLIQGT